VCSSDLVLEEFCDFPDLWGCVCEFRTLGIVLDSVGGVARVIVCCICFLNLIKRFSCKLLLPAISSIFVNGESEPSFKVVAVACQFVF
jgi:hypothetical protein